jgi:adenosine deaminase
MRSLSALPKAHLHLHLTGAMRHATLVELADRHGIRLPPALTEDWPPQLSGIDERGWFRFQRLYDMARSVLRTGADVRRLLAEIAEDERAEGSGWLEIQLDPDGYSARFGGITAVLELVLDAAAAASRAAGIGIGVIVAANRTKHPLEARTLARLAAQYADRGVTGFGLSNDERRGPPHDFAPAFRIAERAGLLLVPHGGELAGPASVAACLDDLHANRIGHGVRAAEDPAVVKRLAAEGITCEVCPSSNVALGVTADPAQVPLRALLEAGVPVTLGADDPLLFGPRLAAQYEIARHAHGFTDAELADLARTSVLSSVAPEPVRARLLAGIDAWLTGWSRSRPGGQGFPGLPCHRGPVKAQWAQVAPSGPGHGGRGARPDSVPPRGTVADGVSGG